VDYNLDIVLAALVFHREIQGGSTSSVTTFANSLFNRFDAHIRQGAVDAGITLTADQRTVVATVALMLPGTTSKERAREALATYISFLGS
jgi:hypothetical protein